MSAPTAITCPGCRAPLRGADRPRADTRYVSCGECGVLVALPGAHERRASVAGPRPPVPMPPGISLQGTPSGIVITRRWMTPTAYALIPLCLVWDGALVLWYAIAFGGGAPLPFLLFPLIHVAVGAGVTYTLATRLVNRTRIAAGNLALSVEHGPLPWPGRRSLSFSQVEQIYVKERRRRRNNTDVRTDEVWAVLRDGTSLCLLGSGLELNRDQALYIEQQLETVLEIPDRPMRGETAR